MSITLVAIETQRHDLARLTIGASMNSFDFDKVLVFADREIFPGVDHFPVHHFADRDPYHNGLYAYCEFMTKDLLKYITTSHVMYIQSDAMLVNPKAWDAEFLQYDYIGAPWPFEPAPNNVGNGGFSLRSRKLLEALQDPRIQLVKGPEGIWNYQDWAEDSVICKKFRPLLEQEYGIKIAPFEVAQRFAFEYGSWEANPFGVHGLHNVARYASRELVEQIPDNVTVDIWYPQRAGRFVDNCLRRGWQDIAEKVIKTVVDQRPQDVVQFTDWCQKLSADTNRSVML